MDEVEPLLVQKVYFDVFTFAIAIGLVLQPLTSQFLYIYRLQGILLLQYQPQRQ
jgi:hypothetical protein